MARPPIDNPPEHLTGADRNAWLAQAAVKRSREKLSRDGMVLKQVKIPAHRYEELQRIAAQWRSEHSEN